MNEIALVVADTTIRRDEHGRYCLNDLHRAAGEQPRHRPHYWMDSVKTRELIAEVEIAGIPAIQSKQGLGTFVIKPLVYAYAMWISAAFHLKVIEAYDALVSAPPAPAFRIPQTLPEALRLAAEALEGQAIAEAKVAELEPKAMFHDEVTGSVNDQTIAAVAKVLGTGEIRLFRWLREEHILMANNLPFQQHIDAGRFHVIERTWRDQNNEPRISTKTMVTGKGVVYLQKRWTERAGEPA
jgi:phage antirepressor YoqD-like protein